MRFSVLPFILIWCFLLPGAAAGQDGGQRVVPRLSALRPALGLEFPVGRAGSLLMQASVGVQPEVVSTPSFIQTQLIITPQLSLQPRYYFDLLSREANGQSVTDFSADFLTLDLNFGQAITQTGNFFRLVVNPAIGLQRSWGRSAYVSIQAGPSVTIGDPLLVQGRWLGVDGQINLGWRLGRKNAD